MDHILSSTGIEDPLWAKIWSGNAGGGPRMRKTLSTDIEEHRYRENSGFKFCHTRRRIINFGTALSFFFFFLQSLSFFTWKMDRGASIKDICYFFCSMSRKKIASDFPLGLDGLTSSLSFKAGFSSVQSLSCVRFFGTP